MHHGKSHKRGGFCKVRRAAKRREQQVMLETMKVKPAEVPDGEVV